MFFVPKWYRQRTSDDLLLSEIVHQCIFISALSILLFWEKNREKAIQRSPQR